MQAHKNSEVKKVGDAGNKFEDNIIDQDFLKRSHVPFASVKNQMFKDSQEKRHVTLSPNVLIDKLKTGSYNLGRFNSQFKTPFENSNLPFSPTQRFDTDNSKKQFASLNKTNFSWKSPTYMK